MSAVVVAICLATSAPAQTNAVSDDMLAGVQQLVQAAVAAGGGDASDAVTDISTAETLLSQAQAALATAGLTLDPVKYGKQIASANKKLIALSLYLQGLKQSPTAAVKKTASAASALQKLANLAGKPLLVDLNAKSAGFYKAGSVVSLAFAIPPGCTDWNIYYTATANGVVASARYFATTGAITVMLGSVRGSADVVITGCGLPAGGVSREIYNYGAKPSSTTGLLSGTWLGNYSFPYDGLGDDATFNVTWILQQSGQKVSGTYTATETDSLDYGNVTTGSLNTGTVSGNLFSIFTDGGLEFVGTIGAGNTNITGTVQTGSLPGSFSISKQ